MPAPSQSVHAGAPGTPSGVRLCSRADFGYRRRVTTTLIAKRTRVGGLIETEGDVVVEGRVEGTIRAGGCVTIGVSGVAVSDVEAARAMVLGILIGNCTALDRIDVAASARIIGDVRAPAVVVAATGLVEGTIEETHATDEGKPTLRLRQNPVVRPARSSGNLPVAAGPAPATNAPTAPPGPPPTSPPWGAPARAAAHPRPRARSTGDPVDRVEEERTLRRAPGRAGPRDARPRRGHPGGRAAAPAHPAAPISGATGSAPRHRRIMKDLK
jgi:cytoskeletal protein CcmA (bactofilin family)